MNIQVEEGKIYVLDKQEIPIAVFDKEDRDTIINPRVKEIQNGEAVFTFSINPKNPKWEQIKNPENLYIADNKVFSTNFEGSFEEVLTENDEDMIQVTAYERQTLLRRKFVKVWNSETGFDSIDTFMVVILSNGNLPLKNGNTLVNTTYQRGTSGYALEGLLFGTGWTVGTCDVEGTFDLETDQVDIYENILKVQELWGGILIFDSFNKVVHHRDETQFLPYNGYEVKYQKNMQSLEQITNNKIVTKLCPLGEGGLNIKSVNNGSEWITNFTYTDTVLEGIENNPDIYDSEKLLRWGQRKLQDLCKPRKELTVKAVLLKQVKGYELETIALNDIVEVINYGGVENVREQLRVVGYDHGIWDYSDAVLDLSDVTLDSTDIFKKTVQATNNINEGTLDSSRIVTFTRGGQSLNETLLAIDDTIVQTKAELIETTDALEGRVETITTDVDNLNEVVVGQTTEIADLKLTAQGLESDVSRVSNEIENLSIGGKNLLFGSDTQDTTRGNYRTDVTEVEDTYSECNVFKSNLAFANIGFDLSRVINTFRLKLGDKVTYSVYNKTDEEVERNFGFWTSDEDGIQRSLKTWENILNEDWTRFVYTFEIDQKMMNKVKFDKDNIQKGKVYNNVNNVRTLVDNTERAAYKEEIEKNTKYNIYFGNTDDFRWSYIIVNSENQDIVDSGWLDSESATFTTTSSAENILMNFKKIDYTQLTDIPYNLTTGSAVTVGTDIYLLGSGNSNYKQNYKYDTLTDTYTKLTDIPYGFYYGSAVAINTDIYLFGTGWSDGTNRSKNAYKYDTLTDTYTQLTDIPYSFYQGSAVAVGTDVYIFGGGSSSTYKKAYKYNTLTDTYTQLTDIPYNFVDGTATTIGTNIYLIGSSNAMMTAYKYDTTNDTYTQLANIPYYFKQGSAVAIGTDIYLLGSGWSQYYKTAYKYNTLTNTYTQLTDIPYEFYWGSAVAVGTNTYLFGGNGGKTTAYKYNTLTEFTEYDYENLFQTEISVLGENPTGISCNSANGTKTVEEETEVEGETVITETEVQTYQYWAAPKFEKGKYATDWSPAPDDLEYDYNYKISNLSTRINQTATKISLTATDNVNSASITIKLKNDDGTELDSADANITLSGMVKFVDLSTSGSTTINGSNITTGTINGNNVNVTNINASNIKTGTLTGRAISGGSITGTTITNGNNFSVDASGNMTCSNADITGGNINLTTNTEDPTTISNAVLSVKYSNTKYALYRSNGFYVRNGNAYLYTQISSNIPSLYLYDNDYSTGISSIGITTPSLSVNGGSVYGAVSLYNNTSGTTGTVSLSDDTSNYDYIEVYYKDTQNSRYGSQKIYSPDGKSFWLNYAEFPTSSGTSTYFGRAYTISSNSITPSSYYGYTNSNSTSSTHTNRFSIVRVNGYK